MFKQLILFVLIGITTNVKAQSLKTFADSIIIRGNTPEICYAVVTKDTIKDLYLTGYHRNYPRQEANRASENDFFHLGSNSKAITAYLAAMLVEEKKITWDTKFFDLYPDWKSSSDTAYSKITLIDLLSHRAKVRAFTSGLEHKLIPEYKGTVAEKRMQFSKFVLGLSPVKDKRPYNYSNAGYSLAAIMLEKVTGRSWEMLVDEMMKRLNLRYHIGWPNTMPGGEAQPYGHWIESGDTLKSLHPQHPYNLALIEPAGDISMPLPDYAKFIQLHMLGLSGIDTILKSSTYKFIHTGIPEYAAGWLNFNKDGKSISEHAGSAGTFFCYTLINRKKEIAYIIITNAGAEKAKVEVFKLLERMMKQYDGK